MHTPLPSCCTGLLCLHSHLYYTVHSRGLSRCLARLSKLPLSDLLPLILSLPHHRQCTAGPSTAD
eukprot:1161797-Pelagomonas_calceolata.AAC.6